MSFGYLVYGSGLVVVAVGLLLFMVHRMFDRLMRRHEDVMRSLGLLIDVLRLSENINLLIDEQEKVDDYDSVRSGDLSRDK